MRGIIIIFNHRCSCLSMRSERSVIRWMLDSLTRSHVLVDQTSNDYLIGIYGDFRRQSVKMDTIRLSLHQEIHRRIPFREFLSLRAPPLRWSEKPVAAHNESSTSACPRGKFFLIEPVNWRKPSGNRHTSSRRCVYTNPNTQVAFSFTGVLAS